MEHDIIIQVLEIQNGTLKLLNEVFNDITQLQWSMVGLILITLFLVIMMLKHNKEIKCLEKNNKI